MHCQLANIRIVADNRIIHPPYLEIYGAADFCDKPLNGIRAFFHFRPYEKCSKDFMSNFPVVYWRLR